MTDFETVWKENFPITFGWEAMEVLEALETEFIVLGKRIRKTMKDYMMSIPNKLGSALRDMGKMLTDAFRVDSMEDYTRAAAIYGQELAGALAGAHPARLAPLVKSGALAPFGLPAPKGEAANAALSRLDSLPDDGLLRWWALGRICGADMGAVCQLLGFSGKALAEWDRLGRAFAAVCADGEGLHAAAPVVEVVRQLIPGGGVHVQLVDLGLNLLPELAGSAAFCLLDDRWQRVWPLWEEQQRCGYAYNRQMLAVRPATLMEWGIRGKKLGRVMDGLVEMVIRDPSLNRLETLLQLAGALALLP